MTKHDPEALDRALAELIEQAQIARDCYLTGNEDQGRQAFELAISALCQAVGQLYLKNRK